MSAGAMLMRLCPCLLAAARLRTASATRTRLIARDAEALRPPGPPAARALRASLEPELVRPRGRGFANREGRRLPHRHLANGTRQRRANQRSAMERRIVFVVRAGLLIRVTV